MLTTATTIMRIVRYEVQLIGLVCSNESKDFKFLKQIAIENKKSVTLTKSDFCNISPFCSTNSLTNLTKLMIQLFTVSSSILRCKMYRELMYSFICRDFSTCLPTRQVQFQHVEITRSDKSYLP